MQRSPNFAGMSPRFRSQVQSVFVRHIEESADLNKDGRVNALDETLLLAAKVVTGLEMNKKAAETQSIEGIISGILTPGKPEIF